MFYEIYEYGHLMSLAKLCNKFCYSYIYVNKLNQLT